MTDEKAEDLYPTVIDYVRQNLGIKPNDESKDDQILKMSRGEVFRRFMTWNGIIGYEGMIKAAIEEIYQVELKEKDS